MTAPHPYAQGVGSRVSSSARAFWCAASYPRAWREGRRRSHSRQGVPDRTRAGGVPVVAGADHVLLARLVTSPQTVHSFTRKSSRGWLVHVAAKCLT